MRRRATLVLLTRTAPDTPYAQLVPAFVLWGGGLGLLTPAFGALAAHSALEGLHQAALIAAALYLVAAVTTGLPSLRWSARTSTPARARPR